MRLRDFDLLNEIGLTTYERKALITLMVQGVADAETICREGEVPTSKIYRAMEKLCDLGLVEIQPTRPKLYSALSSDEVVNRLIEVSQGKAERFATQALALKTTLAALPQEIPGRKTFVDLALGVESHVKRHLIYLTTARSRILSYLEHGDLTAIDEISAAGFPILRRVARNARERNIDHRMVFGFAYRTAPHLVAFLRTYRAQLEHVTGVRYSGELGHPFHVIDNEVVILSLDHPFIPEGRFASLLVRDKELAQKLADGFETLWTKAMHDLREISFQPARSDSSVPT